MRHRRVPSYVRRVLITHFERRDHCALRKRNVLISFFFSSLSLSLSALFIPHVQLLSYRSNVIDPENESRRGTGSSRSKRREDTSILPYSLGIESHRGTTRPYKERTPRSDTWLLRCILACRVASLLISRVLGFLGRRGGLSLLPKGNGLLSSCVP